MSYVSPIKIGYEAEPEEGWTDKIGKYLAGEVDNLVLQSCVKVGCHVDKDELEKALRYDRYQYVKGYEDGKRDAAAAIEDMAKHITEMHERVTVLQIARGELEAEVKRLKIHCADCEYGNSPWPEEPVHEPKRGEWIDRYDEDDKPFLKRKYVCSACGGWNTYGKSKYCPKCGAKMEVQDGQ